MLRSGRPSLLTERDKTHLVRTIKSNRFKPLREITNQLPTKSSISTMWNALKEHGVNSYTATKKPNITPKNIKKRKDWCQHVSKWSEKEWKKVIWSDESSVELNLSSRKIKVWRAKGECYNINSLAPNQ